MRSLVNPALDPSSVAPPSDEAAEFHAALAGYAPSPLRELPSIAAELGLGAVALKDESDRLGLPAFKVLGASWAVERALRERPDTTTLVAASAGNHGRAVAHVAALGGLRCLIFLPERSVSARRRAIEGEGAELVVVDGTYEDALAQAAAAGAEPGALEIADVGASGPAHWVIDGYATLFAEAAAQGHFDLILVPVGVGSLGAAAARFGAAAGVAVVAVEPARAGSTATTATPRWWRWSPPGRPASRRRWLPASQWRCPRQARTWPASTARRSQARPGPRCTPASPAAWP